MTYLHKNKRSVVTQNFAYKQNFSYKQDFVPRQAFTLIEILVAVSIMAFIILAVSSIFKNVSDTQRDLSVDSLTLNNVNYFLKLSSDNIKYAEIGDGVLCSIAENNFFNTGNYYLDFIKDGECYSFELVDDGGVNRIMMYSGSMGSNYVSSKNINIDSLSFQVEDAIALGQPIVTVFIKASSVDDENISISAQTSISIDYYE